MFDTTSETVLFYIAYIASTLFILKIILMFIGGDTDSDSSFASDAGDSDGDFGAFSINSILCFFMGSGWVGLASLKEWGFSLYPALFISILGGFFSSLLLIIFLFFAKKLNQDTKPFSVKNGETGSVYLKIPAFGIGKISIKNRIIKATSEKTIESFKPIRVLEDKDIDINTVVKVESLQ